MAVRQWELDFLVVLCLRLVLEGEEGDREDAPSSNLKGSCAVKPKPCVSPPGWCTTTAASEELGFGSEVWGFEVASE